jgi:para-aminobenzoate synthetase component 1
MISPILVDTWDSLPAPADLLARLPREPYRFLLESQGGPADVTRWSFLGHRPLLRFQSRGRTLTVHEAGAARQWQGDPLEAMQTVLARYPVVPLADAPPFTGGAVGYFSYDLGRQVERLPATARDDLELPEVWLAFYDHLLAIDHQAGRGYFIAMPLPGRAAQAVASARELERLLKLTVRNPSAPGEPSCTEPAQGQLVSNFTRAEYCLAVERALDHIGAGRLYQVNLAQRFSAPYSGDAEALYQRLRIANPAPFAAFLDCGEFQIVSASPERFLQFDPLTRRVETRPIKGTRRRGRTPAEDEQLKAELLCSEKDAAELVMIVDLERNDLGKVCEYGAVRVPDLRRAEAYPTVWHTVATVEGRARPGTRCADLLRAAFPGGSITGAPKIRAMQIIEDLEGLRRHVYCGAMGYVGFDGRLDLNIAIRTLTLRNGQAYFHAGGGIVADSVPDAEYEETLHKARALAAALGFVL